MMQPHICNSIAFIIYLSTLPDFTEFLATLILLTFASTCFVDHHLKMGFAFVFNIINSSKDSTKGAPNVSGSKKLNNADVKLAEPKISKGK